MKLFNKKCVQLCILAISASFFLSAVPSGIVEAKSSISDYLQECPWIGLIADEITYGPITISKVSIHDGDKLAFVSPGATLNGKLKYKVDSKDLDSLHLYHLVVGIKNEGAQDCITHSLGLWSSKGRGEFTLIAPESPGVYEVRFLFTEALTCGNARDVWDSGVETPSAAATIGVIIVK